MVQIANNLTRLGHTLCPRQASSLTIAADHLVRSSTCIGEIDQVDRYAVMLADIIYVFRSGLSDLHLNVWLGQARSRSRPPVLVFVDF